MTEICFLTAQELRAAVARRELSAREVVVAHLDRIERVDPEINAIVTMVAESALAQAPPGPAN